MLPAPSSNLVVRASGENAQFAKHPKAKQAHLELGKRVARRQKLVGAASRKTSPSPSFASLRFGRQLGASAGLSYREKSYAEDQQRKHHHENDSGFPESFPDSVCNGSKACQLGRSRACERNI